ncbi:guided entry of tail-anchored proteins factor 1-like [Neodiprion virginianus]|uniref:Guided entry of tail-anchored proteins factor 1 n=1 Tax=Neodiprion lecontei TaxID=441921 RepID=A0ABM3FHW6_NEOLC|nr:guided entry of tail-anchored proteins factor 1-like [Neodiprion fabricii]XP_046587610.1 guided entry of tail-anchored proteins factor 1 [Neodiprion lecontei]XP_046605554.1 guided entry of tail-anchored proteins factor 1-like [Neodiprion virginianus]
MNYLFIISTASCVLELVIPAIAKFLTDCITKEAESDRPLHRDLIELNRQMEQISMVDEFAKYARLQRQCNKLEAKLSTRVQALTMSRMKLRLFITYTIRILNGIIVAILLYLYRLEPIAVLPKDALWPLQNILSWPCPLENSVSLTMWLVISRLAISSLK